ncbi:MAG: hypothetical protein DRO06_04360 [Thermoproteota archaeon]|nr:MAG: hypothetical protein DRO06_04360 [Candidatus Korarchaeota archaeon]
MPTTARKERDRLGTLWSGFLLGILLTVSLVIFSIALLWIAYLSFKQGGDTASATFQAIFGLSSLAISIKALRDLIEARKAFTREERVKIVSLLQCRECGLKFGRRYRPGEYVGMAVEDRCPKCSGSAFVTLIYSDTSEGK